MATATKAKNGTMAAGAVADFAAQASEEAQATINTFLSVTDKVNEQGKSMLDAQQRMMQNSFNLWQEYSKSYADFVLSCMEQSMEQSVAFHERFYQIFEDSLKKSQELTTAEQKLALEAVETCQAQLQATTERVAEMFAPVALR